MGKPEPEPVGKPKRKVPTRRKLKVIQGGQTGTPTGGQADETGLPTSGQNAAPDELPTGGQTARFSPLPTGGQTKARGRKQRSLTNLPTGGQNDDAETQQLKSILPTSDRGYSFEAPRDDKGFKIKLRWRVKGVKQSHIFERLGKHEWETLKGVPYEQQCWLIADRLLGELFRKGRRDLAARLRARSEHDGIAGAEYQAESR